MRLRRGVAVVGIAVATAAIAIVAVAVAVAGDSLVRVADDPEQARTVLGLPAPADGVPPAGDESAPVHTTASGRRFSSYLLVGSDAREGLAGMRADVIMLALVPEQTATAPVLVSLPRDLWVADLCNGGRQRLNAALNGCGSDVTGAQLLTLTVQEITGVAVDHYVGFDFAGFEAVVAAIGGVEVCTAVPVRDRLAHLDLPGGCVTPSPDQALAWVRARHLEEFVGGRWQPVPGINDLSRNERQQQLLLQLASTLADVRSPLRLRAALEALAGSVTLGERLPLDELVAEAWRWRHLDPAGVDRPSIPVTDLTTAAGAQVLLPPADLVDRFGRIVARLDSEDSA